jgi:hypothetical protein
MAIHPRQIVPYVLLVSIPELGHPVRALIQMKTDDLSRHSVRL